MDPQLEESLFRIATCSGFAIALYICFWLSSHDNAVPYGRHYSTSAPTLSLPFLHVLLPTRLAWSLMECPPLVLTPLLLGLGRNSSLLVPRILTLLFVAHYAHRALLYPLRMRPNRTRTLPLFIFLSALVFNVYNTYIQVRSLSHFVYYPSTWPASPQFLCGTVLFVSGMVINICADSTLRSLRAQSGVSNGRSDGSDGYGIPRGGLFELISCPNYFGELLEWLGWAIATSSAAGLVFFVLCASNLAPRAVAHHQWYLKKFPDEYPRTRKTLIPFLF